MSFVGAVKSSKQSCRWRGKDGRYGRSIHSEILLKRIIENSNGNLHQMFIYRADGETLCGGCSVESAVCCSSSEFMERRLSEQ